MKRIPSIVVATTLAAGLMTAGAGTANAEGCTGWADIATFGPVTVQNATGNCRPLESGSSVHPSHNGEALFNLLTVPTGAGKWFQIIIRDGLGLSALFGRGIGTNTWYI
ncbi:hypothetical protein [Corynebacterium sp. UBA2622]|uniref:hypothetical protein n=1 Tax=Corynebacterium sp. UBA2622 TaxID=1946393 RepID=UPI0025C5CE61|nr:hypothetical protein [Corynebacterium sp. UBA2622]